VVAADFLRYDLPRTPYKVFGNMPFAVTSAIVQRLTEADPPPIDAQMVMQREAAGKLAGSSWAPESLRSLTLKPRWHVEIVERFRRTDFEPPPAVDTVPLTLARRR
jgi:23S rRNA (adenine-N6)-dimethyltransferase